MYLPTYHWYIGMPVKVFPSSLETDKEWEAFSVQTLNFTKIMRKQ